MLKEVHECLLKSAALPSLAWCRFRCCAHVVMIQQVDVSIVMNTHYSAAFEGTR